MTEDEQHHRAVVGRLFALLTAKFEDAAELAVSGQDPGSACRGRLASEISSLTQEIAMIADGLLLILEHEDTET